MRKKINLVIGGVPACFPDDDATPGLSDVAITRSSRVTAGRWFGKVRKSGNSLDHWNRAH
jgi:hypothetical protein